MIAQALSISAIQMQVKVVAAAVLLCIALFAMPQPVRAAGLTEAQIQAVVNLIASFGADAKTVANADAALRGKATSGAAPTQSNTKALLNIQKSTVTTTTQPAQQTQPVVAAPELPIVVIEAINKPTSANQSGSISVVAQLPQSWATSAKEHYIVFSLKGETLAGFFNPIRVPGNSKVTTARIPLSLGDLRDAKGATVIPPMGTYVVDLYTFDQLPVAGVSSRILRSDLQPAGVLRSGAFLLGN